MTHPLTILKTRLKKIGIEVEFMGNAPWIYMTRVNNNIVLQKDWDANWGYTVGFSSVKLGGKFKFADLKRTFELIRKYK